MQTNNTHKTKTHKTTTRGARRFVQAREAFKNSNNQLFGRWVNDRVYAVFSYGAHWPLFIWDAHDRCWFANEDRYSVTTSKHYSSAHPHADPADTPIHARSCIWMKNYLAHS